MIDIVIPTIGRPSLGVLLASLASSGGPVPGRIIIVDDRPNPEEPLEFDEAARPLADRIRVLRGGARGPAAARNTGWRAARSEWVAFLDDDVVVSATWLADIDDDLRAAAWDVAGSQGRIDVPLPQDRAATDWERNVAGLARAQWITADCAYRRTDLEAAGGFDERFPRAFREDADLALRIVARGRRITSGRRRALHPVRPAPWNISIRLQAGNADDVLMEALHGRDWYERAAAPRGAFRAHARTVSFAVLAGAFAGLWAFETARFALARIAPGPKTRHEVGAMLLTSVAIPFAAVAHRIRGYVQLPRLLRTAPTAPLPAAVLFDRDGTLVADVPFNADPEAVQPLPGAREALDRLRRAGIAVGMISNQSGVGLGKFTRDDLAAVNERLEGLVGAFDTVQMCTHAPDEGCRCRKPQPKMILDAARELGVRPDQCVMIGDIGADIDAARAAGARAILVPTSVTLPDEVQRAETVAFSLAEAVDLVLGERAG